MLLTFEEPPANIKVSKSRVNTFLNIFLWPTPRKITCMLMPVQWTLLVKHCNLQTITFTYSESAKFNEIYSTT